MGGCLIFSIGTTLVFFFGFFHVFFFSVFFTFFFFYIISDVVRMRAQLFGMIVIGTLVIWLVHTTTGELIPTRRERINGIVDRLTRVKLLKDVPARGRRNECLDKDEICGPYGGPRVTPCCSPYVCKSSLLLPYCRPK